ncbi:MAG: hypothetical protein QXI98_05425 [Candidatus Bathyarchaeia archaeon]
MFFPISFERILVIKIEYATTTTIDNQLLASPKPRFNSSITRIYTGVRSSIDSSIETSPISSEGAPIPFNLMRPIITYRFTEHPIIDVEMVRISGAIGLTLYIIDKTATTTTGIVEESDMKVYRRALTITYISIPEVNCIQRLPESEALQLLTSINGMVSEYTPTMNVREYGRIC